MTEKILPKDNYFKHYEMRACLGEGGSGKVFEAWDTHLHRPVAIRQIKNLRAVLTESFISKVRIASALQHSAFVKIHAIEEAEGNLFVVMELAKGLNLKSWIQQNAGKEALALAIMAQIAGALKEAHAMGLIYGDLTASKFIVESSGKVRILDLGLANQCDDIPINAVDQIDAQGSIAYMAQERFNDSTPSVASDVYALGTILYEMVTGALPFANLKGLALIAAQVQSSSDQWTWPESISSATRELILAMTARQIEQRFSIAQVVVACEKLVGEEVKSISSTNFDLDEFKNQLHVVSVRRKRLPWIIASLGILSLVIATWLTKPYWPQIAKAITPYSESREMEQGISDLIEYSYSQTADKLDSANIHFKTILDRTPENAAAVGYLSLVYLALYQAEKRDEIWLQKAKASVQQALKLDSHLAITQIANARILTHHNKLLEALAAVDQALALESKNLFAWQTKMTLLLMLRKFDEAIELADLGASTFPRDKFLLELKCAILIERKDYAKAEEAIRLALERQPDSTDGYALLAFSLERQNRISEALQALQQGLQIQPSVHLYSAFGTLKFEQGDYVSAVSAFESTVSTNKGIAGSYLRWRLYAEALIWIPERKHDAIKAFEKAKELLELRLNRSPHDPTLLVQMGLIEARLGNKERAKILAKQAVEIPPQQDDTFFLTGLTYELVGERDLAIAAINRARQLGISKNHLSHPILNSLRDDPRYTNH